VQPDEHALVAGHIFMKNWTDRLSEKIATRVPVGGWQLGV
jgi:hypothetical protein